MYSILHPPFIILRRTFSAVSLPASQLQDLHLSCNLCALVVSFHPARTYRQTWPNEDGVNMPTARETALSLLLPIQVFRAATNEPFITGPLLYILTRGPVHIRERIFEPFRNNLLAKNGASRIGKTIAILKIYFVIGVLRRLNQVLNRIALNGWALRRQGEPFLFGPTKQELVLITGGSSGFGYEMVKAFSKVAKVIVFDVNEPPQALTMREFSTGRIQETLPDIGT